MFVCGRCVHLSGCLPVRTLAVVHSEVRVGHGCFPLSFSTIVPEMGFLIDPEINCFVKAVWAANSWGPPISDPQC